MSGPSLKSASSVQSPESSVQSPAFRVQSPASSVQRPNLGSRVQEFRYAYYISVLETDCVPFVLKTRSCAFYAYVLTCQRALYAYVVTWLVCSRACVLTCLGCFRAHMSTCFSYSRAHVSTCLESLTSHGLFDYVIICQHGLSSQQVILMPFFSVSLPFLLKVNILLARFFESLINVFLSNVNSYIIPDC